MTRAPRHLARALPLAALMTLAVASAAKADSEPPIFHCNPGANIDRQAEMDRIREEDLPRLRDMSVEVGGRERRIAMFNKRLKELELGAASCKELSQVERSQVRGTKAAPRRAPPPKSPVPALEDDSLIAPAEEPKPSSPLETDDLIAPAEEPRPSEALETDDLIAPAEERPSESLETDDLIAPANDDLLEPVTPKPTPPKPAPKPKPKAPMQPFPAPVGDPMFGGF